MLLRKSSFFVFIFCSLFIWKPADAQKSYSSQGKDFWFGFMTTGNNISPLYVHITSDVATCGKIEIPLAGWSQAFTVPANGKTSITLPNGTAYLTYSDIDQIINKGVHVITDDSVTVCAVNAASIAHDAALIYPTPTLGKNYVTTCYRENISGSGLAEFMIAATQNNTTVQITPSSGIVNSLFTASRASGVTFSLVLNAGQVYDAITLTDLTGSVITSDKPIAVFSGNVTSFVGGCSAGDHLYEQMLPPSLYGRQYLTAPFKTKIGGDMFRFVSFQNGTQISINGGTNINLNALQWKDTVLAIASEIISNNPIAVSQMARGQSCDNQTGDPNMITIHPANEMNTNSVFNLFNTYGTYSGHYVNIITATANTGSVLLNGAGIAASFSTIPANPLYSYAQMTVATGTNRISCPGGFLANAYAFASYNAQGYAVGHLHNTINAPVQIANCSGQGAALIATPGSNYNWSPSTGLSCLTCQTVTASPTIATSYTVSFLSATGCNDVLYFNVDVDSLKDATMTPVPAICLNDPAFNYTAVDTGGIWSGIGITNSSLGTFDPVTAGVGTHTIIYSITSQCGDADTSVINVIQFANATISAAGPFCTSDLSSNLNTITPGGVWTGNGITNSSTGVFDPGVAGVGTHTVTYSIGGSCGDTGVAVFTVYASPIVSVTGPTILCLGDSVTLSATGGGYYLWNNGSLDSSITVSPAIAGTYTYSVLVGNSNCTITDSITINVLSLPTANAGLDDTICIGDVAMLNGSGGGGYLWNTGQTTNSISVSPFMDSTFFLIAYSGSCSDTDWVNINVEPYPVANAGIDLNIFSGQTVTLNASGGGTYSWSPSAGLSCIDCPSPLASPIETTTYVVTVVNEFGCTDVDTIIVYVETNCGKFDIPTAFSPNGDGENDVLYVYAKCVQAIFVEIYDRWGNKVAEITNISEGWDGTFENKLFNSAVFVYSARVKYITGEEVERKGNISLVR